MELIKTKGIEKNYRLGSTIVQALRGIDITIENKEFIVIVGPSGSGKSTLLHMLSALDTPSKGTVLINGRDISKMDDHSLAMIRRNKIGFIFQTFNLIPTLTALENVLMPIEPTNKDKIKMTKQAIALLKDFGLGNRLKHKPSELSGGERQRVAIARALINDPEIIFADEPTGNLDSKTGGKIIDLLKKLNKEYGKTIVVVTHDESLLNFATRKIFIKDGRILKDVKSHLGTKHRGTGTMNSKSINSEENSLKETKSVKKKPSRGK